MNSKIKPPLYEDGGRIWADSRDVAEHFGRRHVGALQAYRDMKCGEDFRRQNFQVRQRPDGSPSHFLMTHDGFFVLGLRTRRRAAPGVYFDRFWEMERELKGRQSVVPPSSAPGIDLSAFQAFQKECEAMLTAMREALDALLTAMREDRNAFFTAMHEDRDAMITIVHRVLAERDANSSPHPITQKRVLH